MGDSSGAAGFGSSPNMEEPHTIYELRFPASTGIFVMRLGDPVRVRRSVGGSGGCDNEDEPNEFSGTLTGGGGRWTGPPVTTTCTKADPSECAFFDPTNVPPVDPCAPPRQYVMDGVFDATWKCVRSARGRYTRLYVDWVADETAPGDAGGWLVMLNDWLVNDQGEVPAHCYNRFSLTTGGGSERWRIRVYGDQTVWVEKNGVVVQQRSQSNIASGAVGFGTSPNAMHFNHTIFELRFPASVGIFSTRLGDPVRYVSSLSGGHTCVMEDDPHNFTGAVTDAPSDRRRGPLVSAACTAPDPADCAFFNPCAPPRAHVLDGAFDATWACVTPVRGRYTWAYFD